MQLNKMHPTGPHAAEVLVLLGHRFEQLDLHGKAVASYQSYLSTYPKHDDALAMGKRAVCLARSVGDHGTAQAILSELEHK